MLRAEPRQQPLLIGCRHGTHLVLLYHARGTVDGIADQQTLDQVGRLHLARCPGPSLLYVDPRRPPV